MRTFNDTPKLEPTLFLMIDRKSLVLDVACTIQSLTQDVRSLVKTEGAEGITSIITGSYARAGIRIETSHVTEALDAIERGSFLFSPRIHPVVAKLVRLVLTRDSWWKKTSRVAGGIGLSLLLLLIVLHFVHAARYRAWSSDVASSAQLAVAMRQEANLYAYQAGQLGGTPDGMRIHARAALDAVSDATKSLNHLYVSSTDPDALRASYEASTVDAKTAIASDKAELVSTRSELARAKSEISLAQQLLEMSQKWGQLSVPADLPGELSPAWQNVANSLQAGLRSGDINAVQKSDQRLTFIHAAGSELARDQNFIQSVPAAGQASASVLLDAIFESVQAGNQQLTDQRLGQFKVMEDQIPLAYTVKLIVAKNMKSGVVRKSSAAGASTRFYLLAQAIDGHGQPMSIPVYNTETNTSESVQDFGIEVPKDVFDEIESRKLAGAANVLLGTKATGTVQPDYNIPVLAGTITHW